MARRRGGVTAAYQSVPHCQESMTNVLVQAGALFSSIFLIAADPCGGVAIRIKGLRTATARRAALGAGATSWTLEREEDGSTPGRRDIRACPISGAQSGWDGAGSAGRGAAQRHRLDQYQG
jgi:hypothetical protein